MARDEIGEQLAGWGKVALIETRGRRSGRPARAAVQFIEEADGAMLIAAGSPDADWALNLVAAPECRVIVADTTGSYRADLLEQHAERAAALTALILKYGTPAERLGAGPVFRLRPLGYSG